MSKKPPQRPKSTEDILREMEEMSRGVGSGSKQSEPEPARQEGGALKSLLGFFVKVVPEEELARQAQNAQMPAPPPRPRANQEPTRVSELVAGERSPQFDPGTAANAADRNFDEIYRDAGIADSPCTVDELGKLMENPAVANQPVSVKVVAVNLTLSARGIGVDVPIADAARRDRALDAYQSMLDQRVAATEQRNAAKIQQITQETEEYLRRKQAEIEALKTETADSRRQAVNFSARRATEEKRLADLIAPFLEGSPNPVSIGNKPGDASQ